MTKISEILDNSGMMIKCGPEWALITIVKISALAGIHIVFEQIPRFSVGSIVIRCLGEHNQK